MHSATGFDINKPIDIIGELRIYVVWQTLNNQYKELIRDFWLANHAIPDAQEALRRTQEVVCLALDAQGLIAGVSTVYIGPFGPENKSYYFFRTFIKPDCRKLGLALRFVKYTYAHLVQTSQFPVSVSSPEKLVGMVIITENLRLKLPRINRWLSSQGFQLLGLMPDQKEVWKKDFSISKG